MGKWVVLFFVLGVTACGFEPTYATKTFGNSGSSAVVESQMADIAIDIIPNRSGQFLRNRLIDNLYKNGYPTAPRYRLSISNISEQIVEIGIAKDSTASRAQLRLEIDFVLIDLQTQQVVLKRKQRATTGYNILSGQYTTYVTEADAREQGLNMLAQQITAQLELYFSRNGAVQ